MDLVAKSIMLEKLRDNGLIEPDIHFHASQSIDEIEFGYDVYESDEGFYIIERLCIFDYYKGTGQITVDIPIDIAETVLSISRFTMLPIVVSMRNEEIE